MNGGFYPLKGHMCQADYDGVVETTRTADGTLFPMPITPDVSEKLAEGVRPGQDIVLRDQEGVIVLDISGTELPAGCAKGWRSLIWFSFPEVVKELRRSWPSRSKQGFTLFFTHCSGAGKSAIANALMVKLMEMGGRPLTPLDGDAVRKHLSTGLRFSKEHRDINIRRIGYVAREITRNGGIAI